MVKKKKEKKESNPYRQMIYSRIAKERKEAAETKLRDKGVLVGEGYNVKNLQKEYRKEKFKESIQRIGKKLQKLEKKRVVSRSITKPTNIKIRMKEYNAPSVLGDENRFFKGEMNREKKEMFFS